MEISQKTKKILKPLEKWKSQAFDEWIGMGTSTRKDTPMISHAKFIADKVLPALSLACERMGQENVAEDLVEVSKPLYKKIKRVDPESHPIDEFWAYTVAGRYNSEIPWEKRNSALIAQFGVKYILSPIVELALVHEETKVFCVSKFFSCHACRMGEIISRFSKIPYLEYIGLCKTLLQNGIYDWSLELDSLQWETVMDVVRRDGMKSFFAPIVQAMLDCKHLPGTLEAKYKHSLMSWVMRDILPILVSLKNRGIKPDIILRPLVEAVLGLGEKGYFKGMNGTGVWRRIFLRS